MPKFDYYITDTFDGDVKGTNDKELATQIATSEDFFVVDAARGVMINTDGLEIDIEEITVTRNEIPDDDDDDEGGDDIPGTGD